MKSIIQKIGMVITLLWTSISALAYDFEVDGIAYTITSFSDLTCSVSSSDETYEGEIVVPSEVTFNGKMLTVTSISDNAFENSSATGIKLPQTIIEIGKSAFANCSALNSVELQEGIKTIEDNAFYGCETLSAILFPETIERIGISCFGKCKSLKSAILPKDLSALGKQAFIDCSALEYVDIGNISVLEDYTFFKCESLKNISWGANIRILKNYVFANCGFENFVIPNTVIQIGQGILSDCESLTSFTLGNGITSLSSDPILNSPVKNLIIVDGDQPLIFKFGSGRFSLLCSDSSNSYYICDGAYCNKQLEYIYIGREISTYIDRPNYGNNSHPIHYIAPPFYSNKDIKTVKISSNVNYLNGVTINSKHSSGVEAKHYAYGFFEKCSSLESLIIDGLNIIGEDFANGCISLKEIEIPNNVTTIAPSAFQSCANLETVILGSKLEEIGNSVFDGCNSLISIYCKSEKAPSYSTGFTKDIYLNCNLFIPFDAEQSYKSTSPWDNFWNVQESHECVSEFKYDGLIYSIISGNNVVISGNDITESSTLIIPTHVNYYSKEYNVIEIGKKAFKNNNKINSIIIPSSIAYISDDAFFRCSGLKNMTIEYGENALTLGHTSTVQFSDLITPFPNPSDVDEKRTGFQNGYYDGLFYGLPIEHLVINRDIELPKYYERTIGSPTSSYSTVYNDIIYYPPFYGLTNLKSVEIGENVSAICKNQIEAVINAVPTTMEYTNFGKCDNIEVIVSNNPTAPIGGGFSQTVYENATLFLPKDSEDSYNNDDYWKRFSHVKESPFIHIESISFGDDELIVGYNESKILQPIINPIDASIVNLKWDSSNPSVATVSEDGTITSYSREGETIITALACDGYGASASIKIVVQKGAGISDIFTDETLDIRIKNGKIVIKGKAETDVVDIYNIQGQHIESSTSNVIDINAKGIYIIKIGSVCKKVIL